MELIALLLIFYFLIGACVCLLICVNPNDPGLLGRMNRLVFKTLP
jgi:palmitoyltransferase